MIFRAELGTVDDEYARTAESLRDLAIQYGCIEVTSTTENNQEITISYWNDLEQIKNWKQNPVHLEAQHQGQSKWYSSYKVQFVKIVRQYEYSTSKNSL